SIPLIRSTTAPQRAPELTYGLLASLGARGTNGRPFERKKWCDVEQRGTLATSPSERARALFQPRMLDRRLGETGSAAGKCPQPVPAPQVARLTSCSLPRRGPSPRPRRTSLDFARGLDRLSWYL